LETGTGGATCGYTGTYVIFLPPIEGVALAVYGVEGLPAELPAKGAEFKGTISIPTALLDDVKQISLSLTDYPAQKLKLQLSDIPVEKGN
jgi:hypothetical protein